jgi:hypothetical protein
LFWYKFASVGQKFLSLDGGGLKRGEKATAQEGDGKKRMLT